MRLLLFYARRFAWTPHAAVSDQATAAPAPGAETDAVVAFCHVEPLDVEPNSKAITKTAKNVKWLAGKFETSRVVLHSFGHLGGETAPAAAAAAFFDTVAARLRGTGYSVTITPFGWTHAFELHADGPGLAKVYKAF